MHMKKLSTGIQFYVQRNTGYSSTGSVIPYYQVEQLNIGSTFNLASGVFTARTKGRYHFSFVTQSGSDRSAIFLRVNGVNIAYSDGMYKVTNMPITATLNLKKGDRVDTVLLAGSIYDDSNHNTQFSGILLEEDFILE